MRSEFNENAYLTVTIGYYIQTVMKCCVRHVLCTELYRLFRRTNNMNNVKWRFISLLQNIRP